MPIADLDYIVGLHRTETDALGFIPQPAILRRMVGPGHYVIVRDRHGRRRGYLLHGPPTFGRPLHIYQVCVELDHRLRGHAAAAVREIYRRAATAGATEIILNCGAELEANAFWLALGFTPIGTRIGGAARDRLVVTYSLPVVDTLVPRIFTTAFPELLTHAADA